ncbi:ribosome maturation factor RimP [Arsenicicoccus bolidensis]|uniref:ribosome maturation factor RimP n=1 Tax=Arsenicicoccus bolidensis TaxID=229480 RepID=UPI000419BDFF|nr:ribosome maturation factor RimP [Arsenicicoccus bolidensis]
MVTRSTEQDVRTLLDPALAELGLMVEQLTVQQVGKRRLVRLTVDTDLVTTPPADETTAVEPLDLDLVADATRRVSELLDESEVMGEQPYVLEVGSPGVDRLLTEPRHFRRNVGRLVKASTPDGQVTGRVVAAGPEQVTLEVTTKGSSSTRQLAYPYIARAQVQVEFTRATEEKN